MEGLRESGLTGRLSRRNAAIESAESGTDEPLMRHHFESLEQRQLLAADLSVSMVNNLPEFIVPGDKLTLAATVANGGDELFNGLVTVRFLAPNADAVDPVGVVATVQKRMKLKPGASAVVTAKISVSDAPAPGVYAAGAEMILPEGSDEFDDNNVSMIQGAWDLRLVFGSLGSRRNTALSVTDADGTLVTFSLRGGGFGEFLSGPGDDTPVLRLSGTGGASVLAVTTKGGDRMTDLGLDIEVDGSLRSINAATTNMTGGLNILGTLGSISVRDVTDFDMGIGSAGPAMTLKMGHVANMRLASVSPIAAMTVASWSWVEDVNRPDLTSDRLSRIDAPWMLRLTSAGDFSAIVTLSGGGAPRLSLGSATIGGVFSGEMIVLGEVGALKARNIEGGLFLASGNVASFTCVQATLATLWAGSIIKVDVGTVVNLEVAAGASFSAEQLGAISDGDGSAVSWGTGAIADIKVKGHVERARFAAGVNPVNGVLLDVDDIAAGNGVIGRLMIGGSASDVLFAAVTLPANAKIGGVMVLTAEDGRFLMLEPVS